MFDWLYGPRLPAADLGPVSLRNVTLDIDTFFDLAEEIPEIVKSAGVFTEMNPDLLTTQNTVRYESNAVYKLRDRVVDQDRIRGLGVPDRNQLQLEVTVSVWEDKPEVSDKVSEVSVQVVAPQAMVFVNGQVIFGRTTGAIAREVARYVYANATHHPDWPALRWAWWLIPIPIAVAAWVWVALTVELPVPVHALILAVIALASFSSIQRAAAGIRSAQRQDNAPHHRIRFRGESRVETQQRRADTRQNVRVALVTAPIAIGIGVVGTLMSTWSG
ncbi:hypothetical protein [Microbacterium sp. Leaf320]|uniref:hypothetical protein n=1 Tax=Microbacterium sp. Leaf320 TaxID=1736334 RepID=UPI0006FA5848|nr:hypothetical protein [Microbacterium sp. Leaf320]KQQ65716.1 hypothetical protein ASF63_10165 [Microbacterium sp. Leaf320]